MDEIRRTIRIVYNELADPIADHQIWPQIERLARSVNNPIAGWGTTEYHYSCQLFLLGMRAYLLRHPELRDKFSFWVISNGERVSMTFDKDMRHDDAAWMLLPDLAVQWQNILIDTDHATG